MSLLPKIKNLKTQNGFSLSELLIVVSIIAILVTLTLPNGIRQLQLYRLDTSVSVISNKLMETRMDAIKRNRTSWLRIDKTAKTAQIRTTNSAGATIDVGFPESFPQGLDLDATNSVEISFDSMGRLSPGASSFILREINSNKRKNVSVSASGKTVVGQMY